MQKTYASTLYELIEKDKNVISCLSDSGTDLDDMMRNEFPNQVINFGISENNKVAVASGLASCGKIPFVYTTNSFLSYRSMEFIRDDVCLQNRNVKLVGMGSGISWSTLGPTHHATEDISVLKAIPNLKILSPASPKELRECLLYAYNSFGPFFIRIGMGNEIEIFDDTYKFVISKNIKMIDGNDLTIFVTGPIISEVIDACKTLKDANNIFSKVINVPTLKPLDEENIKNECINSKVVFTIEEHNIIGGLGSSICDVIATNGINKKVIKIGLNDCFAKGYGTYKEIREQNRLDSKGIYSQIVSYLNKL